MTKKLVICAHPDDETLGLGGTLALSSMIGDNVFVVFFTDGQFGRDASSKGIIKRQNNAKKACSILGIKKIEFLKYSDETLDTVPVAELAGKIEYYINRWKPEVLFTHSGIDVNQDHRRLFEASVIAGRPSPKNKIQEIICYETPSSTEWGFEKFQPNLFVNITGLLNKKLRAMKQYKNEIEKYPHPRSLFAIENRAKFWGSNIGVKYAEAFFIFRKLISK